MKTTWPSWTTATAAPGNLPPATGRKSSSTFFSAPGGVAAHSEKAAHAEPGPAAIRIDQQHADRARRPPGQNGVQEYIGTLPASADGKHIGPHVLILIYLSDGKLRRRVRDKGGCLFNAETQRTQREAQRTHFERWATASFC